MKPKNIEDMYPLSPMQQGMLFHARYAPDSALYFVQWATVLRGDLNAPAFQEAWQAAIDRHPALRTIFIWEGPPSRPARNGLSSTGDTLLRVYSRTSWQRFWRPISRAGSICRARRCCAFT